MLSKIFIGYLKKAIQYLYESKNNNENIWLENYSNNFKINEKFENILFFNFWLVNNIYGYFILIL